MNKQMFSIERFYYTKKECQLWKGVFEYYSFFTDRFIRVVFDTLNGDYNDAPYGNNERTNIGMLASACWSNGWIALEEYSTEKIRENKKIMGRCDLWVSPQGGKDTNYAIEAKKGECSLGSPDVIGKLDKLVKKSVDAAEKLSKDEGDKRIGLAFMQLFLKESKHASIIKLVEEIEYNLKEYSKEVSFAYLYLKDKGIKNLDSNTLLPGIIVVGKVID